MSEVTGKWIMAAMGGAIGYLAPTGWLMLVCMLMILADSYTAYQLSTRVKSNFPVLSDGKFRSNSALKAIRKMRDICIVIILAYMIEDKVVIMVNFYLPYIAAGAFCFIEAWSILENKSSCNDNNWAKVLQKIMVDKTARHFDIDPIIIDTILHEENKPDTASVTVVSVVQDAKK